MTRARVDAGIAGRLLVLADRVEVAAEDRLVQRHGQHERGQGEGEHAVRDTQQSGRW